MCRVLVDGKPYEVPDGRSVLDTVRALGIHLPSLCHDDRLAPSGACRTCLVRISGMAKPVPSCTITVSAGMEISTSTPELEQSRHSLLEMLARHYPAEAIERSPDKAFHQELRAAGLSTAAGTAPPPVRGPIDLSHPYIAVDMARCIDCYRCVRICAELQGQFVWHVRDRGGETRLCPDGPTLRESSCVSCGACVDTCPTGALEDRAAVPATASGWTRTVCPYCGVGCELNVGTVGDAITTIRPVLDSPVSKGHLCVKGRYAFGFVSSPDRITEPMIRDAGGWRTVTWNEAYTYVADRLWAIARRSGRDSIGVLGSARATNEDNYVAQKLARVALGTNNVDCCARVCHAPSAAALKATLGAGLATNAFDDIERARAILVCGANPTESHPVIGARIKQAALRGTPLIVIDPRRVELARHAAIHLALRPGTNVALLNAMASVIVSEQLYDASFVAARVSGFDGFARFVAEWTPERAAAICDVDADLIRAAARLYAGGSPAMCMHGLGVTEHTQGTDGVTTLVNLALLTGNVGKPGSGVNPLRGQNNVQGAAHMGCDPHVLPGSTPLADGRPAAEALWDAPVPQSRGLNALEMMDAAQAGQLKALWTIGYDVLLTNPNLADTVRAMQGLELMIVQDMFLTETARRFGTVFLPACSSFEKDGTFMNAERRIQRVRAAVTPAGHSRPDWRIVCEVARALGASGFDFGSAEEIWDEVRDLCPGARGMTYRRLDEAGLQWPCPAEDHPGTPLLHRDSFALGPRAILTTVDFRETPERTTEEYPLRLVTGRTLYQFNAGTMTMRTPNDELQPSDVLSVSPVDAKRLAVRDGDRVRITSRYGTADLLAQIDPAVRSGELFATFHRPATLLNAVTGPHRDQRTGTPEYKVTAVRLEATT